MLPLRYIVDRAEHYWVDITKASSKKCKYFYWIIANMVAARGVNRDNTVLVRTVAAYVKRRIEVKISNISDHVHTYMVSIIFEAFCNI